MIPRWLKHLVLLKLKKKIFIKKVNCDQMANTISTSDKGLETQARIWKELT